MKPNGCFSFWEMGPCWSVTWVQCTLLLAGGRETGLSYTRSVVVHGLWVRVGKVTDRSQSVSSNTDSWHRENVTFWCPCFVAQQTLLFSSVDPSTYIMHHPHTYYFRQAFPRFGCSNVAATGLTDNAEEQFQVPLACCAWHFGQITCDWALYLLYWGCI